MKSCESCIFATATHGRFKTTFTVADPADKETLNNRKTTRQVFAYKPGNGLLLQSRMYNTSGGYDLLRIRGKGGSMRR